MGEECNSCGSNRIAYLSGKCSDLCAFDYKDINHDGYVPYGVGIGGGDYIEIQYCLECGKIQDTFPVSDADVRDGTK